MSNTDRKFLGANPSIWLSRIMLGFTLMLAAYYLFENEQSAGWRTVFVLGSMALFMLVHCYYWRMRSRTFLYPILLLDFVTAASYGYVFIQSDFPDHLFVGITAMSVFLYLNRTRTLIIVWSVLLVLYFLPLFALEWFMIEDISRLRYIDNGLFILFASIVGFLLNNYQTNRMQMMKLHGDLQRSHSELKLYAAKAEELGSIRERVRIARDIHDAVGHKLTALLVQLQVGQKLYTQDNAPLQRVMQESEDIARSALHEVRLSVRAIRDDSDPTPSIAEAIRSLTDDYTKLIAVRATLNITGIEPPLPNQLRLTAYRIAQESLTNAHRHGRARAVAIELTYLEDRMILRIHNDGYAGRDIKLGFGLINMRERVLEWNGTLRYLTSPEDGFTIEACLPYPDQPGQSDVMRSVNHLESAYRR
jgi:signal transduction histidine kinase